MAAREKISEFFLHLASYGGFNLEEGVIKMWGDPSSFIPVNSFTVLFKELEKLLKQKTNDELFYWLGRLYGKNSTLLLMNRYGINKNDVKEFVNGATQDGFGYMKVKNINIGKITTGEVTGSNAAFALNYKKKYGKSKKPVDSYIKGVLTGGAEPLFDLTLDAEEKKCMAMGDKECLYYISETNEVNFNFFKKTSLDEKKILEKTKYITLRRKAVFKLLKKKDIVFGDGSFILQGVKGINLPIYGIVVLDKIMDELITQKKKEKIYEMMAKEYIASIKTKLKGVDLGQGLKELEKFGYGKFEIKISGKNKIIIENNNNPFSIDYKNIFGKSKEPRETMPVLLIQELLMTSKIKTKITQKMSISQGKTKNIYVVDIIR